MKENAMKEEEKINKENDTGGKEEEGPE